MLSHSARFTRSCYVIRAVASTKNAKIEKKRILVGKKVETTVIIVVKRYFNEVSLIERICVVYDILYDDINFNIEIITESIFNVYMDH